MQNTLGVDFCNFTYNIDNIDYKINIWDTAGQGQFLSLSRLYYTNSHCIFLMFDLTNRSSFTRLNYWCDEQQLKLW